MFGVVAHEEGVALFPLFFFGLAVEIGGEGTVDEGGEAVADVAFHGVLRQFGQAEGAAHGVGGGGEVGDGIAECAV